MFATSHERVLPADLNIQDIEEITLHTAAGEQLDSWYGQALPGRPTILYLHGNGGSVSSRHLIQRQFIERGLEYSWWAIQAMAAAKEARPNKA